MALLKGTPPQIIEITCMYLRGLVSTEVALTQQLLPQPFADEASWKLDLGKKRTQNSFLV